MFKKITALVLFSITLMFSTVILAAGGKAHVKVKAHIKVIRTINQPTNDNSWLVNNELDIYRVGSTENIAGNITMSGWTLGLQMNNIQVIGPVQYGNNNFQINPMVALAKSFKLTNSTEIQTGTMWGTVFVNLHPRPKYNFNYAIVSQDFTEFLNLHGGIYYANRWITYTTNKVGYMVGFELKFTKDFSMQGDYISDHSNVSGAVVNFNYKVNNNFQTYVGVGIPERNNGNEFYGIVGFNLLGIFSNKK
jgi:hypothetical protein